MQTVLDAGAPAVTVEQVLASLKKLRVHAIGLEYDLQAAIAAQFDQDGIPYQKEAVLGPRNRIDFLIPGGIGVEVKKGKPNSGEVMGQVERYAKFDAVSELILVVERSVFQYERSTNGKPVHYVALNKLWGIAL
jgi:hypothetical protein